MDDQSAGQAPDAGPGDDAPAQGAGRDIGGMIFRAAKEIAFVVLAALVLSFVLKTFLVQSFFIPSQSMENTFLEDDRVMVSKLAPGPFGVHRGDIVVFADPGWLSGPELPRETGMAAWLSGAMQALGLAPSTADSYLIKRVIGTGGDRVECVLSDEDVDGNGQMDGKIAVNGVTLDEEVYLKPGEIPCEAELNVLVPEGSLWLMGDNRGHSGDSRAHQNLPGGGAVELDKVVGVAKVRTWPLNRLALLRNPGAVFSSVPEPEEGSPDER
jgi:signal peptidase I